MPETSVVLKLREATCIECKHFRMEPPSNYGCDTCGGNNFFIECKLNLWSSSGMESEEDFRMCLLTAQTCKDFKDRGGA